MPFRNVDVHVGKRLRQRRIMLGMSQDNLGAAVGLTFQQIQKYERGANRIGASRLYEFSQILDVPITFFFDEAPPCGPRGAAGPGEPSATPSEAIAGAAADRHEILELVRAYYGIKDRRVRTRMFDLVKSIGKFDGKSVE